MRSFFKHIVFLIFSLLNSAFLHLVAAEEGNLRLYDESIFVISNYSGVDANLKETRTVRELLDLNIGGFRFYLEWEKQQNQIMLKNSTGGSTPFIGTLVGIREKLEKTPDKILTLFLDFSVNVNELENVFEQSGLDRFLYVHNPKTGWPALKTMVEENRRLIVFAMQHHRYAPDWLNYIWDFAVEPYFSLLEAHDFKGEFLKGDPKNSLLIYNDYNLPRRVDNPLNRGSNLTQNPYLIEHIKNTWANTGKMPNFIMLDRFEMWIVTVTNQLRSFKVVKGTVSFNAQILDYVSWVGSNSLTNGKFSFPIGPGDNISLIPKSPGYRFKPESVVFEEPAQNIVQHFIASPLEIDENLEAYYTFENGVKDNSLNNRTGENIGVTFMNDSVRSTVAWFDNKSHIVLTKSEDVKIRDHDFTITAWIKIREYLPDKDDYCIIGTKTNTYQQGIHLLIRKQKPYFGFYSNDLEGNTRLKAGKWYHLTWRYNKENGEQAIFVNGKLDSKSLGHPSFKGRDNLFIGVAGFSWVSNMYGAIDDLAIWSRALGEDEIWGISNEVYEIVPKRNIFIRYPVLFTGGILLLFVAVLVFAYLKFFKNLKHSFISAEKIRKLEQTESHQPWKNYIRLFGTFKVIDKEGNNITTQFTPKIKQLFLLIMLYSQKNGITTKEMTDILWPGQSYQGAKNSRGVTIRKLRLLLESIDKVEINFNIDRWTMEFSGDVYCDYIEYLNILEKKGEDPSYYLKFYQIIRGGEVFKGEMYEWLDDFKGNIGNSIIDMLLKFLAKLDIEKDNELVMKLANRIFETDPVNEQALQFKLNALVKQNNYNTARFTYDKFCALYREYYGETFSRKFDTLIP
ncbi:MAG: LamG-like jellyroll fold domain-containing protein [Prolixibacteraceae bacterium]|nr:LamG-like jellyroll fold domain-containing protein [Prolixibacteraceae bacterium]